MGKWEAEAWEQEAWEAWPALEGEARRGQEAWGRRHGAGGRSRRVIAEVALPHEHGGWRVVPLRVRP